ncbi:beta-glucoside-specific PTS transporter subunit IIABC [Weissella cibaria]|uniref:beta-glucoside-specific PTS transporter subunit IIABC n=1 Tax=Weissella cibaria TaxID=137591 RepID=UPI0007A63FBB|nr:beta-glucoside-specific PTS transporter subunit IIABC [Weissella cibaria]MCS8562595.1 PTS beta-glucoside transporter subunit IIABC [Weissella cibaria]MCS8566090.1 PTS beta-glucoside transporter subunit IIABC [Weissella cibaria]MCS8577324.1 PTS beta-glucoside transporter subunit IIABC [Weissella cibaria]QMU88323.1 PTS glucose transporter subunit IIA [Weissella cibaria]TVV35533.1 PTS beta-glucoside transporter subunit IIABC [Weissella cibaria]
MDYEGLAKEILTDVGGKENINTAWHCATRLRFKLKDEAKAQTEKIENLDGVVTVVQSAGQYQVVIGNSVANVFEPLSKLAGLGNGGESATTTDEPVEKDSLINRFIGFISSVFTPFLGAMAGTGVLKGLLTLLSVTGVLKETSGAYQIWYAAADGFFYFLPVFLAITAARRLKVNEFVAIGLAVALLYPNLVAAMGSKTQLDFFGIPVVSATYSSSVIPILLAIWLLSYIQPVFDKFFHESVRNIFTPMFSLALLMPITVLAIGPLGTGVGTVLSGAVEAIYNVAPLIAGAIMGALWEVFVIFGVHWTFVPVITNTIAVSGHDPLQPILTVAVIAQAGALLGVFLKTKNTKLKSLSGSATLSALLGITEPGIYGVTLKLKKPFIFAVIGGAIGGAIAAVGGAQATAMTLVSLLGVPTFIGPGFMSAVIGLGVGFIIPTVLTYFFGVPAEEQTGTDINETVSAGEQLNAPIQGTILPLSAVKDPVFASEAMGKGLAIVPTNNDLVAPADATVAAVYPSKHAIGLVTDAGAEILLHIGIDTVQLDGQHFEQFVEQGQKVKVGDKLVTFDRAAIAAAGYDTTVMMIVTNTPNYTISETSETEARNAWVLNLQTV